MTEQELDPFGKYKKSKSNEIARFERKAASTRISKVARYCFKSNISQNSGSIYRIDYRDTDSSGIDSQTVEFSLDKDPQIENIQIKNSTHDENRRVKKRLRLTHYQTDRIMREWDRVKYDNFGFIEPYVATQLSKELKISLEQVKKWFINRRWTMRKKIVSDFS